MVGKGSLREVQGLVLSLCHAAYLYVILYYYTMLKHNALELVSLLKDLS